MKADDPTLPDRIHLRTLVEHGLAPMLKKEPMEILEGMLGDELPPEPVFVNLTAEQLERCIQAAQRAMSPPPQPALVPVAVPVEPIRDRLALSSEETAKALGISRVTHLTSYPVALVQTWFTQPQLRFAVASICPVRD